MGVSRAAMATTCVHLPRMPATVLSNPSRNVLTMRVPASPPKPPHGHPRPTPVVIASTRATTNSHHSGNHQLPSSTSPIAPPTSQCETQPTRETETTPAHDDARTSARARRPSPRSSSSRPRSHPTSSSRTCPMRTMWGGRRTRLSRPPSQSPRTPRIRRLERVVGVAGIGKMRE